MPSQKKQKTPSPMVNKQVNIKLLPYHSRDRIVLPESNNSKKKMQIPLFYNGPIYRGKKHELF
jgi:hypothetical protein